MVDFYAPINNLGYGIHSYNLLKSLDKLGLEIALYPPFGGVEFTNDLINKWLENQNKFNKENIGVMIFHEQYMNRFYGKKRIGFPVFETGLDEVSIQKLKCLDYIIQPAEYFKSYLNELGFNNVFVVPEGYDENVYNLNNFSISRKEELLKKHGLIFSHVGKLEERKSSLDILKVFTQSLDGIGIKCVLITNMYNPFDNCWLNTLNEYVLNLGFNLHKIEENVANTYFKNNLKIILLRNRVKDIRDIYTDSHFGLYASKAEGWNLPLIESIAFGVPCITTDWTGQSEYLKNYPKEFIIEKGEKEIANDGKWFLGNKGYWIKPDLSSMKSILLNIAKNPMKYLSMYKECYDCVKDFTWDNSAKKFMQVYNNIIGG